MLTPEQFAFLLEGPRDGGGRQALVRRLFEGPCQLITAYRRHRQELLDACPMGKRPWAFWMVERRLRQKPAGLLGELRMIRTLQIYHDAEERDFVIRRLAEIDERRREYRTELRRVA